jgi:CRP/FNR family transcriptional regulator
MQHQAPPEQGDWTLSHPSLVGLDEFARSQLRAKCGSIVLQPGETVFSAGDHCRQYFFVQSGIVHVHMSGPNGEIITLYRVARGETCILTTAALLGNEVYVASATTQTRVEAKVMDSAKFADLVGQSAAFRNSVFVDHGRRIGSLLRVIGAVTFESIDRRLADKLIELANGIGHVLITHEGLAREVGSAREVISRRLKSFERKGLVRLGRGRIDVEEHLVKVIANKQ